MYAYVRRLGTPAADAEDLTQGYFARFLEKGVVRQLRQENGRFRSFLFASVRHFMSNERDRERARKRGGGQRVLSLDPTRAEELLEASLPAGETPERIYERSWAQTVVDHAERRLEEEVSRRGGRERFARLRPFLLDGASELDYLPMARDWGVGESAARVALHRLRKRFGVILREEVARTVGSRRDVEDELRHVLGALGP